MTDFTKPNYYMCREWIKNAREHEISWSSIKYGRGSTEEDLRKFLTAQQLDNFWPVMSISEWHDLVNLQYETEKREKELKPVSTVMIDDYNDNEISVPTSPKSSWQLYKQHLLESGFKESSVNQIEATTLGTLKRLNSDTSSNPSVKGLIIGHVQSGKTANMAALMAMAADWGWNFFIVLSGTIENLRKQTQKRLLNDLNHPGTLTWHDLEHLSKNSSPANRLQQLRLEEGTGQRYFTVSLKNSTRLANLLQWMYADPKKANQLKVIVIDDEADQASINTADIESDERTRINQLIVNLVEGNNHKGVKC